MQRRKLRERRDLVEHVAFGHGRPALRAEAQIAEEAEPVAHAAARLRAARRIVEALRASVRRQHWIELVAVGNGGGYPEYVAMMGAGGSTPPLPPTQPRPYAD
ncbi:MAG: hypothetical protein NVS9B10_11600 [Nevskia sp.]